MPHLDLPKNNIAEVTLIGTGGGYGESCILHLGNQVWIVVDSCLNPDSKENLPLEYLQSIGVNVANDVDLILCTHWHDDHINGISALYEAAKNARFSCARAHDRRKFVQFLELDYLKVKGKYSNSSTEEFNKCLKIMRSRANKAFVNAQVNTILAGSKFDEIESSIIALSPTDYTLAKFDEEIGTLITTYGARAKRIVYGSPNAKSVALFVKLGNHRALLGSDLEVSPNEEEGWLNILKNGLAIDKKSSLIKLAHHGSKTGDHDRIWIELLDSNPVAKLTPWNKNYKLPEIEMLQKFCKKSDKIYMTTRVVNNKPKKRERGMEKMIKKFNDKLYEATFSQGIVRSRIDLKNPDATWETDIFEHAFHVNKELR